MFLFQNDQKASLELNAAVTLVTEEDSRDFEAMCGDTALIEKVLELRDLQQDAQLVGA